MDIDGCDGCAIERRSPTGARVASGERWTAGPRAAGSARTPRPSAAGSARTPRPSALAAPGPRTPTLFIRSEQHKAASRHCAAMPTRRRPGVLPPERGAPARRYFMASRRSGIADPQAPDACAGRSCSFRAKFGDRPPCLTQPVDTHAAGGCPRDRPTPRGRNSPWGPGPTPRGRNSPWGRLPSGERGQGRHPQLGDRPLRGRRRLAHVSGWGAGTPRAGPGAAPGLPIASRGPSR